MTNIDSESALRGHMTRNVELLDRLIARGIDMASPRAIEHHFWSKSQRDAALLAHEFYKRGFLLLVLARATPRQDSQYTWNVEIGINDSINHATNHETVKELIELALLFDSRYDGWGTVVD